MELPLLSVHIGSHPDLILIWNDMAEPPAAIDVVLHLHGYSDAGPAMNLATDKLKLSGLDFGDPERPPGATSMRNRPTLCILPRGNFFGGRSEHGYDFPALQRPGNCAELVRVAIAQFAQRVGMRPPAIGRRILTAHSGGGAAMMAVAADFHPHELHVYDALYADAPLLLSWVERAIADDAKALHALRHAPVAPYMAQSGRALRVFYIPDTGTEAVSRSVAGAIRDALAKVGSVGPMLAPWFRVEPVRIEHNVMARQLGWRMLSDVASAVQ
jgi:hypothetical protein